jgi:hypothetical protein
MQQRRSVQFIALEWLGWQPGLAAIEEIHVVPSPQGTLVPTSLVSLCKAWTLVEASPRGCGFDLHPAGAAILPVADGVEIKVLHPLALG